MRSSRDLISWGEPQKIVIPDENQNKFKKNYYNPVVFRYNNYIYMLTPYFEACGTTNRNCHNGKTLLLKSTDGISWATIDHCLPHDGKYQHRVNDVMITENEGIVFYRENVVKSHQNLVCYRFELKDLG